MYQYRRWDASALVAHSTDDHQPASQIMVDDGIQQRKADHVRIVLSKDVAHQGGSLLDCVQLVHNALPELALSEIDTSCEFFGKRLSAPLMITSMTGGGDRTGDLNHQFAQSAGRANIAFSVGSQRVLLEHPERLGDFAVRAEMEDGVLLGNIGAQQLVAYSAARIVELTQMIQADGMCVHLNPAHELAQQGGDRDFRGQLAAIAEIVEKLDGRVLVKETGAGMSPEVAARLWQAGVRYLDVAGAGGTSWTKVERHRKGDHLSKAIAGVYGDWGIPTAAAVIGARRACGDGPCIIGSGGLWTGLDAAQALACGADLAGYARAALSTAGSSEQRSIELFVQNTIHELQVAMLLTGCADLAALRQAPRVYTGTLLEWLSNEDWQQS